MHAIEAMAEQAEDLYCQESFEDFYQASARGAIEYGPDEAYYGRDVIWLGWPGRMLRVTEDYARNIEGNIFDPCKLAAVRDGILHAPDRVVFYAPYGTATLIEPDDVVESIKYAQYEGLDRPYTTGDEDLDEVLVEGRTLTRAMKRRLAQAVRRNQGDLGKLSFTIRDGNHRAFGAFLAGEPYIYMILDDNSWYGLESRIKQVGGVAKLLPSEQVLLASLE
jgi:hypothetical protein